MDYHQNPDPSQVDGESLPKSSDWIGVIIIPFPKSHLKNGSRNTQMGWSVTKNWVGLKGFHEGTLG